MPLHSCKLHSLPINVSSVKVPTQSCLISISERIPTSLLLQHLLAEYALVSAFHPNVFRKLLALLKHILRAWGPAHFLPNNLMYALHCIASHFQDIGKYLQEVGHEVGVTTGRKRRCGWLDLVQLRYSTQINGYTSINLTKLDVLDDLAEIKVGIKYLHEGVEVPYFPADLKVLEKVEVEYVTLKGWKSKTSECTVYSQLPTEARQYVEMIEQLLNVRIEWVGVGPGRDRMLTR